MTTNAAIPPFFGSRGRPDAKRVTFFIRHHASSRIWRRGVLLKANSTGAVFALGIESSSTPVAKRAKRPIYRKKSAIERPDPTGTNPSEVSIFGRKVTFFVTTSNTTRPGQCTKNHTACRPNPNDLNTNDKSTALARRLHYKYQRGSLQCSR